MAIVEVKVPQLSESVAEATMLQWKKKVGDSVAADEILIEIETDKVVLEVPAPSAGVLSEVLVADGGTVIAEQLIAHIDTDGKVAATATAAAPAKTESVYIGGGMTPELEAEVRNSSAEALDIKIQAIGDYVRKLKADKAGKDQIDTEVKALLFLKGLYKEKAGSEWVPLEKRNKKEKAKPQESAAEKNDG